MKKFILPTLVTLLVISAYSSAAAYQPQPQKPISPTTMMVDSMEVEYIYDDTGNLVMTNVESKDKKWRISFVKGLNERTIFSINEGGKWIPFFVKFKKDQEKLQPVQSK